MSLILRVLKIEWSVEQWTAFVQFVDYCIVGVINVVVNYLVYTAVVLLLRLTDWDGVWLGIPDCNVHLATIIAFIAMIVNSFYWNSRYTFGTADVPASRRKVMFVKVACSYFIAMLVQLAANVLFCTVLGLPELLINPIDQVITIPVSYVLNKYWAFR